MRHEKVYTAVGLRPIPVYKYEITDSTNTRARELAEKQRSVFAVIANGQTAGRGRLGRSFSSEKGVGIYASLVVRPKSTESALKLTALMGIALCRAIEKLTELSPKIKWVNDIEIEGKKLAGILAEGEFDEKGKLKYVIIGFGINILQRDFGELSDIATSVEEHTAPPKKEKIFKQILHEFFKVYDKKSYTDELDYYKSHSSVLGKEITVLRKGESFSARAKDIDESFSLIIERDGVTELLSSAEVSIRRKSN